MGEVRDLLWQPQGRGDNSKDSCKDLQVRCLKGTCHGRVVLLKAMKSVLPGPAPRRCTCLSFAPKRHKINFQMDLCVWAHEGGSAR